MSEAAGDSADFHLKDLEVYREAQPPAGYSIEEELDAIDKTAAAGRLERFHLLGYSGGGFISLAYAGTRPHHVISLAVFEPARIPGQLTAEEASFFTGLEKSLEGLSGDEFMATFIREQVKPGARLAPPPTGPVSVEMRKRPAGIAALIRAFDRYQFDRDLLRAAALPVYYAYGDMSHQEQALKAGILAQLFGDIRVERFAGIHHFVPPEQIYTAEHVHALLDHWRRAEAQ